MGVHVTPKKKSVTERIDNTIVENTDIGRMNMY